MIYALFNGRQENSKICFIKVETSEKDYKWAINFTGYPFTSYRFGGDLKNEYAKDTFPL